MIEENFLIFQAPKECITWPCAWIRTPNNKDIHKGPIKIAYHKKIAISNAKLLIILIAIIPATKT
ncbi:hypothetical protein [Desulfovibrio piger]|uniref:hypothetical protein n=1 Tax=Desulfovibrio piger TaxID=901 RepID=UPI0039F5D5FC